MTERQLTRDILKITMAMRSEYPELSKYIDEMPATPFTKETPLVNIKNLQTYFESLQAFVRAYSKTHVPKNKLKLVL
jgi:hypothetical protein